MGKKVAFQIDPLASLNVRTDSTLMLIEEAQFRGYDCYIYHVGSLHLAGNDVRARLQPVHIDTSHEHWAECGEAALAPLSDCAIVWMRQDPPVNAHYTTAANMLSMVPRPTRVYNDPLGVLGAPEKLSPLRFAQFTAPTLVSQDQEAIRAFVRTYQKVVSKPLYGYGGHGVYVFEEGESNLETFLEEHTHEIPRVWQAFLPEVATEERRIIMIGGKVQAIFGRTPKTNSIRSNMRVGGTPVRAEITPKQEAICAAIAPYLLREKLLFAGIDVIGDTLNEINITCPTGLRAVQALYQRNLATIVWDKVESDI